MDHKVFEHQLKGGGKVLLVHIPGAKAVSFKFVFNSGYAFAPTNKSQVSHLMEHLMTGESAYYPDPLGFAEEVEKEGAYYNATTSAYFNKFVVECGNHDLDRVFGLMFGQIELPSFSIDAVVRDASRAKEEISGKLATHSTNCGRNFLAVVTPLGMKTFTESLDHLARVGHEDVIAFYQKYFNRRNMRFVASGDFSDGGKHILELLEPLMAKLPEGKPFDLPVEPLVAAPKPIVTTVATTQVEYDIGVPLDGLSAREMDALRMLRRLLTGSSNALLSRALSESGVAYGAHCSLTSSNNLSMIEISSNVTPANAHDLFRTIAQVYRNVLDGAVSDDMLRAEVQRTKGQYARSFQTVAGLLGWYEKDYLERNDIVSPDVQLDAYEKIRRDDIVAIAQKIAARPWVAVFEGPIDAKESAEIYQTLAPIWQHS